MTKVVFTSNIQRHVACPELEAAGRTCGRSLENVFTVNPLARRYVLDDQSALRKHMIVFVDGQTIRDRAGSPTPWPRPARSTCSKPCQAADDVRHASRIDPQRSVHGVAPDGQWEITDVDFLGDNVSITLTDRRDGRHYAALDHGHFGAKLHRSIATGWEEIAVPTFPPKPEGYKENDMWGRPLPWTTVRIWALEAAGLDQPGVIWCGTIPGGLFRSSDRGDSWEMMRSLWHHPKRKQWMGGGADLPGIHSICIDPHTSNHTCVSQCRPGASGSPRMPAQPGHNAARVCAPSTSQPS